MLTGKYVGADRLGDVPCLILIPRLKEIIDGNREQVDSSLVADVFVSYSRADRGTAERIVKALRSRGWSVWWDKDLIPGETWDDVIEKALRESSCAVVLWSTESVTRRWVKAEASEAERRGILVPVLLEEVEIPLAFRHVQAATLIGWKGSLSDQRLDILYAAIARVLPKRNDPPSVPETSRPVDAEPPRRQGSAPSQVVGPPLSANRPVPPGATKSSTAALTAQLKWLASLQVLGTVVTTAVPIIDRTADIQALGSLFLAPLGVATAITAYRAGCRDLVWLGASAPALFAFWIITLQGLGIDPHEAFARFFVPLSYTGLAFWLFWRSWRAAQ